MIQDFFCKSLYTVLKKITLLWKLWIFVCTPRNLQYKLFLFGTSGYCLQQMGTVWYKYIMFIKTGIVAEMFFSSDHIWTFCVKKYVQGKIWPFVKFGYFCISLVLFGLYWHYCYIGYYLIPNDRNGLMAFIVLTDSSDRQF